MILRDYQQKALDALYRFFHEGGGNPLVVLPTAAGKSLVIAAFIQKAIQDWPDTRVIVLSHVKELLSQDFSELISHWPNAPAGIYSAGLGARQINSQILIAGIQSIWKRAYQIQRCDLVIVDEAHLIPRKADTIYRKFLRDLTDINPYLRVVGMSATPYRLDSGMLHKGEGALFDAIAYEISVRRLIDDGFLSPVVTLRTDTELDVAAVGTRGGEFIPGQLEEAVDLDHVTRAAVKEIVAYGQDRRSWLVFGSGVKHCEHIADEIRSYKIPTACIFGDTPKEVRSGIIADFKRFRLRCLVSMGVLTTGFNAPAVDLLAMLRPTKSAGLYVQIVGRGTRLYPCKNECIVLDFAGNIRRHGPIDLVAPEGAPSEGDGEAPVKACPECDAYCLIAARACPECGYEFPAPRPKIEAKPTNAAILSSLAPNWVPITGIEYQRHVKEGAPDSLRVTYMAGLVTYREWVCLEHAGFAREKAAKWWMRRAPGVAVPATIADALASTHALARPTEIAVRKAGKYHEIVGAKFA